MVAVISAVALLTCRPLPPCPEQNIACEADLCSVLSVCTLLSEHGDFSNSQGGPCVYRMLEADVQRAG